MIISYIVYKGVALSTHPEEAWILAWARFVGHEVIDMLKMLIFGVLL